MHLALVGRVAHGVAAQVVAALACVEKESERKENVNHVAVSPLRAYRVAQGLRQEDLAQLANLTRITVSHCETGKTRPQPETVRALAEALGVEPGELFPDQGPGQ